MKLSNSIISKYHNFLVIFISLLISVTLVFKWFNEGKMLAAAEDGLPFYDVERSIEISKGFWHEIDMGFMTPLYVTRLPILYGVLPFHNIGVDPVLIQAAIFVLILFSGIYFSYLFFNILSKGENRFLAYTASFFYLFNLYTLSQIFSRFVYSLIFLWALLPAFIYFYIKWSVETKFRYLLLLVVLSTVWSWTYLIFSPVFVLWGSVFVWIISHINKDNYKKLLINFSIGFTVWLVCSMWWILPFVKGVSSAQVDTIRGSSFTSLVDVSKFFFTNEILVLKQSFYFDNDQNWGGYFSKSYYLAFISILFFYTVILGILSSSWDSTKKYFLFLFIGGWFIVKGANAPFGSFFYENIFNFLPLTQAIRNPYEKMGLVFLLGYSFFLAKGLFRLSLLFKELNKKVVFLVSTLLMFCLTYPYWNESLFGEYRVSVPVEYQLLDKSVAVKWPDYRILHMPYPTTGNSKLRWAPKLVGYNEFLFSNPSIPMQVLQGNEKFYQSLGRYTDSIYFVNLLRIMNVCCVIHHKDVLPGSGYMDDVEKSRLKIESWYGVSIESELNDLSLYSLSEVDLLERVYLSKGILKKESLTNVLDNITSKHFDPKVITYLLEIDKLNINEFESDKLPNYSFLRINESNYSVNINNSSQPYVVILANNYNPNWRASIDGVRILTHFKSNGFGNGWIVDYNGSYTIDIKLNI